METQTWLSCHYKFISTENIIIVSISSDDFLHVRLEVVEKQMWNYSSYVYEKKLKKIELKFSGEGKGVQNNRC